MARRREGKEEFTQPDHRPRTPAFRPKKSTYKCFILLATFIPLMGFAVSFVVYFHYTTVDDNTRKEQQLAETHSGGADWHQSPESPTETKPIDRIKLFHTNTSFVLQRHRCIQRIRSQQRAVLDPLLKDSKEILLVDPAYHINVGDHMITLGELTFLGKVRQCDYVQSHGVVPPCRDVLALSYRSNRTALWHGGGNWGDLWPTAQEARIESIPALWEAGFRVISLPQSLYYQNAASRQKDQERLLEMATSKNGLTKSQLVLMWREKESLEEAKRLYPFANHVLLPDMAFQLGPYRPIPPRNPRETVDFLLFLRSDHESVLSRYRNRGYIRQLLQSSFSDGDTMSYSIVDWDDRLMRFPDQRSVLFTDSAIRLLSLGRVLICDRLHAAILAYISGIPFVFVDPVSKKISKTLSAAFSLDEACQNGDNAMWAGAESLPKALKIAHRFIRST